MLNKDKDQKKVKMSEGYIYCFSNVSMPGIFKVGMTTRTPEERLKEANSSNTYKPPTPYKIEFSKKVMDVKTKEKLLHKLFEKRDERINPRREFFKTSLEEIRKFFDLIDTLEFMEDNSTIKTFVYDKGVDDPFYHCYNKINKIDIKMNDKDINGNFYNSIFREYNYVPIKKD